LQLGLGIDAGGTYTDAVLLDLKGREILKKGKVPTTKGDYSIGVEGAIARLEIEHPKEIAMVALSTTLATNAIVENRGGRVGLILIGYHPRVARLLPPEVGECRFIKGRHSIRGEELEPLDTKALAEAIESLKDQVDVFAVSSYLAVRNNEHELEAGAMLETAGYPYVLGHQLTRQLNSLERAITAFYNARLIPSIVQLIGAVEQVLQRRGIKAPLHILKGDGSLMASELAKERPVETILSGPVASMGGARWLAQAEEGLVVDMGGTTTDLAIIAQGQTPISRGGVKLKHYPLAVTTLDLHTLGLGGDSEIRLVEGQLKLGPRRVLPISLLARKHPEIKEEMARWLQGEIHVDWGLLRPLPFYVALPGGGNWPWSQREKAILARLNQGPCSIYELAETIGSSYPSLLPMTALEEAGRIIRVGLTPTDILHLTGELAEGDGEAARMAAALVARSFRWAVEDLISQVLRTMEKELAGAILQMAWGEETKGTGKGEGSFPGYLLEKILFGGGEILAGQLKLKLPLIGVGAPIGAYLPPVGGKLGTKVIIPPHYEVANAVGAVIGHISARAEAVIRALETGRFALYGPGETRIYRHLAQARRAAEEIVGEEAFRLAQAAGGQDIQVHVEIDERYAQIGGDVPGTILVETIVSGLAIGKPAFASD
jgi:N-methylhydantoinase A/oxoprolinase/acetone carboxylase beta subunit